MYSVLQCVQVYSVQCALCSLLRTSVLHRLSSGQHNSAVPAVIRQLGHSQQQTVQCECTGQCQLTVSVSSADHCHRMEDTEEVRDADSNREIQRDTGHHVMRPGQGADHGLLMGLLTPTGCYP